MWHSSNWFWYHLCVCAHTTLSNGVYAMIHIFVLNQCSRTAPFGTMRLIATKLVRNWFYFLGHFCEFLTRFHSIFRYSIRMVNPIICTVAHSHDLFFYYILTFENYSCVFVCFHIRRAFLIHIILIIKTSRIAAGNCERQKEKKTHFCTCDLHLSVLAKLSMRNKQNIAELETTNANNAEKGA